MQLRLEQVVHAEGTSDSTETISDSTEVSDTNDSSDATVSTQVAQVERVERTVMSLWCDSVSHVSVVSNTALLALNEGDLLYVRLPNSFASAVRGDGLTTFAVHSMFSLNNPNP